MVLYDPERKWQAQGICGPGDVDLFFAKGGVYYNRKPNPKVQARWNQAKEICKMCPALAACRRDTLGENYGVWGGLDEHQRWQIRRALPAAAQKWPQSRRLAWGRALSSLRQAGISWRDITLQTGIPERLAMQLITERARHLAERQESTAEVVDLPLPDLPLRQVEFPAKAGRRHAWVRHRGSVSDAFYRGQTADGLWINVSVYAGRGNVHKWVKAEDVHLYQPQPVVILRRREEPGRVRDPAA